MPACRMVGLLCIAPSGVPTAAERVWLSARNLDHVEVDIDANPQAATQLKKWTGGKRITPVFDIDGKIVIDFDEKKLTEALQDRLPQSMT